MSLDAAIAAAADDDDDDDDDDNDDGNGNGLPTIRTCDSNFRFDFLDREIERTQSLIQSKIGFLCFGFCTALRQRGLQF